MRAFFVLLLAVVAYADKLGYNYQPFGHSDSGLSFASSGSSGNIGGVSASGSQGTVGSSGSIGGFAGIAGIGALGSGGSSAGLGSSSGFGGLVGSGVLGSSNNVDASAVSSGSVGPSYSAPAQYDKEFFTFTAPEQEFDDAGSSEEAVNSLKTNLRVVFIRTPENRGLENAVLNLAKQAAEDKTAIYVLQKQSDIGDLASKLNAVQDQNRQKPEVHFVKYRTPEDATNAQQAIQSQYDQLSGNSQAHDGGIVPVHNFASQAPVQVAIAQSPNNSYLPSSVIRV